MKIDAVVFLESLFTPESDAAPGAVDSPDAADLSPGPAAESVAEMMPDTVGDSPSAATPPSDWRDKLTPPERELFGTDAEPPADFIRDVLAVRAAFDGEIVGVTALARRPDPDAAAVASAEADAGDAANAVRLPGRPDDLPEPWDEWYAERAAIREYDGGQARENAEAEALREVLHAMQAATKRIVLNGSAGI